MKPSKKVRWILVLPAMLIGFCAVIFGGFLFKPGDWYLSIVLIAPFLASVMVAPLHGKRFVIVIAGLFIFTCLFPPWRATNGNRHPMGFGSVFNPPQETTHYIEFSDAHTYAQIDFGRLFLEWTALAATGGMGWLLVVKRNWPLDKTNRSQKITPPPSSPEN